MTIEQSDLWIADLNPRIGTETGKQRPVLVVQTDLLNKAGHPSTLICPLTTSVKKNVNILRVHIKQGVANLNHESDIMIDQIRAIDNTRLVRKIGNLPLDLMNIVKENLSIILDLF